MGNREKNLEKRLGGDYDFDLTMVWTMMGYEAKIWRWKKRNGGGDYMRNLMRWTSELDRKTP